MRELWLGSHNSGLYGECKQGVSRAQLSEEQLGKRQDLGGHSRRDLGPVEPSRANMLRSTGDCIYSNIPECLTFA